jgi:hypothetical protein
MQRVNTAEALDPAVLRGFVLSVDELLRRLVESGVNVPAWVQCYGLVLAVRVACEACFGVWWAADLIDAAGRLKLIPADLQALFVKAATKQVIELGCRFGCQHISRGTVEILANWVAVQLVLQEQAVENVKASSAELLISGGRGGWWLLAWMRVLESGVFDAPTTVPIPWDDPRLSEKRTEVVKDIQRREEEDGKQMSSRVRAVAKLEKEAVRDWISQHGSEELKTMVR